MVVVVGLEHGIKPPATRNRVARLRHGDTRVSRKGGCPEATTDVADDPPVRERIQRHGRIGEVRTITYRPRPGSAPETVQRERVGLLRIRLAEYPNHRR